MRSMRSSRHCFLGFDPNAPSADHIHIMVVVVEGSMILVEFSYQVSTLNLHGSHTVS